MLVVCVILEFAAYCCFAIAVFGSTSAYIDAIRGNSWPNKDLFDLLITLKRLITVGTILHLAVGFMVLL